MAQNKYLIIKNEDATKYLSDEQKLQLTLILRTVASGRRSVQKSVGDLFFVLNMKDQFALPAMDAYIKAVQDDGRYTSAQYLSDTLDVACDIRQVAALNITPRIPD